MTPTNAVLVGSSLCFFKTVFLHRILYMSTLDSYAIRYNGSVQQMDAVSYCMITLHFLPS